MNVLTVISYAISILFLIVLFRAVRKVWPLYFGPFSIWWKKNVLKHEFFYFNKGKTKILAKNEKQAYDRYKTYKAKNRRKNLMSNK